MKVSELGEFPLIDALDALVRAREKKGGAWENLVIGIGDDCAVWKCRPGLQLATIDAIVEGVHFRPGMASWEELGWKALAVNLSDIAAMGGSARYAIISLALPPDTGVSDITRFYDGLLNLASEFDVAIVGGNISRSALFSAHIAVFGDAEKVLTRSAACAGDYVAVTGYLGAAAAGLEMLSRGLQFDEETTRVLRQAFLTPTPRLREGLLLSSSGVKAGMDISDGLISDLRHICRASNLGARVRVGDVPVPESVRTNFASTAHKKALTGGEDYELLFTAPADIMAEAKRRVEREGCPVTVVGEMTSDPECRIALIGADGFEERPSSGGWDHFGQGDANAP